MLSIVIGDAGIASNGEMMKLFSLLNKASTHQPSSRREPSLKLLLTLCLTSSIFVTSATMALDAYLSNRNDAPVGRPEGFTGSGQRLFPVGTRMPDFTLPTAANGGEVSLARLRGDGKPVVLVFASFTCTVFQGHLERVEALFHKYGNRARFLFVNIREAGHLIEGYEYLLSQERESIPGQAKRCMDVDRAAKQAGLTMPHVVDADGRVAEQYAAWPLRLMILDPLGQVTLDLGLGSQGIWDLDGLEKWLIEQSGSGRG